MADSPVANSSLKDRVQSLRLPPPGQMRGGGSKLPWLLVLALACLNGYLLWVGSLTRKPSVPIVTVGDTKKTSVESKPTVPVAATGSGPVVESKGYIIPEQQILVSPQVSGRVIELNF